MHRILKGTQHTSPVQKTYYHYLSIPRTIQLWCLDSLGDFVVGHLELGEEDGAVLGAPAVDHRDDLDPPAQRPQVPQVLYRPLNRLHNKQMQKFNKNVLVNMSQCANELFRFLSV